MSVIDHPNGVNGSLTPDEPDRRVGNDEYVKFVRRIARSLGVTRQAAHQRYRGPVE